MTSAREQLSKYATQSQMSSFFIDKMGIYNVKAYGAAGNGVVDDSSSINSTIEAADDDGGIVFFPVGTYKIENNITAPPNITLWFADGAKLQIDSGKIVTINGNLSAGLHQIFAGSGTVAGSMKTQRFFPQWWGAVGDAVNDDTSAINAAITAASNAGGGEVFLPEGRYKTTDTINLYNNIHLKGVGGVNLGSGTTQIEANVNGANAMELPDIGSSHYNVVIEGLVVQFQGAGTPQYGIYLYNFCSGCVLRNVTVKSFNHNVGLTQSWYSAIENVQATYATEIGFVLSVCNSMVFLNCSASHNKDGFSLTQNSRSNTFAGCSSEANSRYGIYITYAKGTTIDGMYFEGNTSADIITGYFSASTNNTRGLIINGTYHSGSTDTNYGINIGLYAESVVINAPYIGDRAKAGIRIDSSVTQNVLINNPYFASPYSSSAISDDSGVAMIIQDQCLLLPALSTAPSDKAGRLAISDGTGGGFDGVSGAGLYRNSGASWTFVG